MLIQYSSFFHFGNLITWSFLFFLILFIYLFWEIETEHEQGRSRERDTESETGSRLRAISTEPDAGLELTDREIVTWDEVGRLTDWATQAPPRFLN